jgi:hypothetical protein
VAVLVFRGFAGWGAAPEPSSSALGLTPALLTADAKSTVLRGIPGAKRRRAAFPLRFLLKIKRYF